MNWVDFLHADSDEIIFGSKTDNPTLNVWLLNVGVVCSSTFSYWSGCTGKWQQVYKVQVQCGLLFIVEKLLFVILCATW